MRSPAQSVAIAWLAFFSSSVPLAHALYFGVAGTHSTAVPCVGFHCGNSYRLVLAVQLYQHMLHQICSEVEMAGQGYPSMGHAAGPVANTFG